MEFLDLITPALTNSIKNLDGSRFIESLLLLYLAWHKVRSHLSKVEDGLADLAEAVRAGFKAGEERFKEIEENVKKNHNRIKNLENINPQNAVN